MCYLPLLPRPVRHQALLVCSRCRCSNGLLVGSAILGCRAGRAVASLVASHVFAEELVLTAIFEQEMGWNSSICLNPSNYLIEFLFECLNILARNKAGGRFGISMSSSVQLYPGNVAGALAWWRTSMFRWSARWDLNPAVWHMLKQHIPRFTLVIFKKSKLRMFSLRKKQIPPKKYVECFRGSPPGNSAFQATFASPGFAISVDLRSTRAWCGGSYPWKNLNDLWGRCTRCTRIFTWFQLRHGVSLGGLVRV